MQGLAASRQRCSPGLPSAYHGDRGPGVLVLTMATVVLACSYAAVAREDRWCTPRCTLEFIPV